MKMQDDGIVARVRRGELNFEKVVAIMRETGYITEQTGQTGFGFSSSAMEALRQDDFEALFSFFFPNDICDIAIKRVATAQGGHPNCYSYAIYNANIVSKERVEQILIQENVKGNN